MLNEHNTSEPLFLFWSMHLVHMPLQVRAGNRSGLFGTAPLLHVAQLCHDTPRHMAKRAVKDYAVPQGKVVDCG